jgi:PAS domain-containing protein
METNSRPARSRGPASHTSIKKEEEVPSGVIAVDALGRILHVNTAATRLLGCLHGEQLLGCVYTRFLRVLNADADGDDARTYADPVARCLSTGEPCFRLAGLAFGADGAPRTIDGSIAPTYNASREVTGAVLMASLASEGMRYGAA